MHLCCENQVYVYSIDNSSTVDPGVTAEQQIELKPSRRMRNQMLVAKCYCKELGEIMGDIAAIEVKKYCPSVNS